MKSTEKFTKVMEILNKFDLCNNTVNHNIFDKLSEEDFTNDEKINEIVEKIKTYEESIENNTNRYPEPIMQILRQRAELDAYDTSCDSQLNKIEPDDVFNDVCNWNGLIRYDSIIKGWIKDIYEIKIGNED